MASSTIQTDNKTTRFQAKVRQEYVRGGRFGPDIGASENSVIQTNKNLKKTSIPLIGKINGGGVRGSSQLAGNETALSNYAATAQPTYHRQGVLVDNEENELAEFDLFSAARPALNNWTMELKRDEIIQSLLAVEAGGTYYNWGGSVGATGSSAASAANLDTWDTNNGDRIIYGAALSNRTAGNVTTSLATIDTTNDKLTAAMVTLAKRRCELANPLIRPVMVKGDEPWYILYVGALSFRDLQNDTTISAANREARPRAVADNPIFTGGDLVYNGVIIKKIADIDKFIDGDSTNSDWDGVWGANATGDKLSTAGNSSSRVGVGFMCGGQAIGFHIGRMASFKRRKEDDYEHQNGVGTTMKHDIKKVFYNNKQHGMLTIFHSASADA